MLKKSLLLLSAAVIAVPLPAYAHVYQPSATLPSPESATPEPASTQAAPVEGMSAVIEEVTGIVQVQKAAGGAWETAKVGMVLGEGASIRTGQRSSCKCSIPPDQMFAVDRLSNVQLTEVFKQGNKVTTNLTMKFGRAQMAVEKGGLDHDSRITSPGAALAVRGTVLEITNTAPFAPTAKSYTGPVSFRNGRRTSIVGSAGGTTAVQDGLSKSAADTAFLSRVIDPQYAGARTPADARLIAQQTSFGATVGFDNKTQISTITGGPGPILTEEQLVSNLPGALNFVARWTGNSDVNLQAGVSYGNPKDTTLSVTNPKPLNINEYIYPGFGLNVSKSGGRIDFDHRGGANGGQETIYWKGNSYPVATYALAFSLDHGPATDVTINAFLNGQKLPLFVFDFGEGVAVTPTLPITEIDLGDGTSFSFGFGKSTTFKFRLLPQPGANSQVALVYIPLDPSLKLAMDPDLNNGAPADLPASGVTPGGQDQNRFASRIRKAAIKPSTPSIPSQTPAASASAEATSAKNTASQPPTGKAKAEKPANPNNPAARQRAAEGSRAPKPGNSPRIPGER